MFGSNWNVRGVGREELVEELPGGSGYVCQVGVVVVLVVGRETGGGPSGGGDGDSSGGGLLCPLQQVV